MNSLDSKRIAMEFFTLNPSKVTCATQQFDNALPIPH